jgi:hypothetical protein
VTLINLDDSTEKVRLWDSTAVIPFYLSISPDGSRIGSAFPWPASGVAQVPNGRLTLYPEPGCFISLTPDNTYRLMIFTNNHRNWRMFDTTLTQISLIDLNEAPGVRGWEISRPRFSNRTRYMTMEGPYTGGSTGPCLTEDCGSHTGQTGPYLEVYFGRLDSALTKVETWINITNDSVENRAVRAWVEEDLIKNEAPLPATMGFGLSPGVPNPFNPTTVITYQVAVPGRVTVKIYNPRGEAVAAIVDAFRAPGTYSAVWNAQNQPAGIYLIQLTAGNAATVRKSILVK